MSDNSSRGGKKQTASQTGGAPKKSGVRPGSTAAKKERGQREPRKKVIPG